MTTIVTEFQIPTGPSFPEGEQGLGPSAPLSDFKPEPVRPSDVVGRRVDDIAPNVGTYGMGGPGFFGLRLGEDWLIIAIWGAGEWLQVAGRRVMDTFFDDYGGQRPWISEHGDELSPRIIGHAIKLIDVNKTMMRIVLEGEIEISIEEDPKSRPILEGSKELRVFKPDDDLRSAVFLSPTREIWV